MMELSDALENYILSHIEGESPLLAKLNRETNASLIGGRMLSGHLQGRILKMLVAMIGPQRILEVGTFTGYSALCMAEGLGENGHIDTIEINDEIEEFIYQFLDQSPYKDRISLHIGDAMDVIPSLEITYDLVFLDGNKRRYLDYYHLVLPKVRKGGFIIADNILWDGKVVEQVHSADEQTKGILAFNDYVQEDTRVENVIFPIRDGLMVLRKR